MSRVARRKQESRSRIINAAERLMNQHPIDEVRISDITEAADVGHGSFYLHFKSKYEVMLPIIQHRAAVSDELIQASVKNIDDSAEVMSYAGRQMGRIIHTDNLWRWFLEHSGVPAEVLHELLGEYSSRDFNTGLANGRFTIDNQDTASKFIFGGYVNSLLNSFGAPNPEQIIDDTMELMLRAIGVNMEDAHRIAHASLKPLSLTQQTITEETLTKNPSKIS